MVSLSNTRFCRRGLATIATAVFTALAVVSAVPPWAAAQSAESPTEAPPVVTLQAFLLDNGGFAPLDVPCITQAGEGGQEPFELTDINNRGQIVGVCTDAAGATDGFLLDQGRVTTLDVPGALSTLALGINNRGQIVGVYSDEAIGHGFLLQKDTFTVIDAPGAVLSTAAFSINDRGQVLGLTARSEEETQ
jgi:uncharacterized membrane protein